MCNKKFKFKKKFGQNFVSNLNIIDCIINNACLTKDDTVIEIGCGSGILTCALAKNVKNLIGYEIDKTLIPILNNNVKHYNNVNIHNEDILNVNLENFDMQYKEYNIISNLPYNIATKLIMDIVEKCKNVKTIIVMTQLEVAKRFCALKSTHFYSALTVKFNLYADANIIQIVDKNNFVPKPKVDSAILKINLNKKFDNDNTHIIKKLCGVCFLNRRKKVFNNIINSYNLNKQQLINIFQECKLDLNLRAENLSYNDYYILANKIYNLI